MSILEILVIAVGLSMDAFAVSLGAAASRPTLGPRAAFRLAFHFGLFQFLMPIGGWLLGVSVAHFIAGIDHWIAFLLLAVVGGRMIGAGFGPDAREQSGGDPSRGMTLVMLSVATSIDALVVGMTLAMLGTGIWFASVVIGLVTASLSLVAVTVGRRLGRTFGRRIEVFGGALLVAIGLRILFEHM